MKQRPSAKAEKTRRARETPASIRPGGPPAAVRSQFAIHLPLGPDQKHIPPSGEQDSPAWQLFYNFLEIFSGISHEGPEMAESGLLAFDVEAAYPNASPGVIPEYEEGPLGVLLREKLPGVIRQESTELQTIVEESPSKQGLLKIAAQFSRQPAAHHIYDDINTLLSYKTDVTEDKQGQGGLGALADDEYVQLVRQLEGRSHAFREQLAAELAPALNEKIQGMSHETLDEKKELARWVNDQLEPLGLAVQCPNTGLPAKLWGIKGNWPGIGTFAFEVRKDGKRVRSAQSDALPELTLVDAALSKEPEVTWQQTVGPKASRGGHKLS